MKYLVILLLSSPLVIAEDDAVQAFTSANNLFTSAIYTKISKNETGNFLVSPFSAETILALAQSGCKGESAEELRNVLRLREDQTKIETAVKSLLSKLRSILYTANKMYVKKDFSIKEEFKKTANQVYSTDSEAIDFTKKVEAAAIMNQWVETQTNNKIKNLIDSNNLDNSTKAVLINALFFKANWSIPFLLSHTQRENFYKTATDVVQVDTLHHYVENFNYYECPHLKAQFLELPFEGGEASMIIVLPREKEGLTALEAQIDQVFAPQHDLRSELLNVALPKFKIESTINFKNILEDLDVKNIFTSSEADLSGIAGEKGDLILSQILQKSFMDVSEEGVEAAPAKFFIRAILDSPDWERSPTPKTFIANHPFIFYIKVKNLIVFAGKVTDPK